MPVPEWQQSRMAFRAYSVLVSEEEDWAEIQTYGQMRSFWQGVDKVLFHVLENYYQSRQDITAQHPHRQECSL